MERLKRASASDAELTVLVDIRELTKTDQQRAFWLFADALDHAGNIPAIYEFMDCWGRNDEKGNIPGGAFFLFSVWAWPSVLELCARKGISKSEINREITEQIKQSMTEFLRQDVTPEEAKA
ncbi:hypothetical protein [Nocardia sp. NPDC002869]|uniref:hypothetical protein n=1 Tax=Nocardia sp. NPDC002869 TaxID=3161032 RepID=UPI00398D3E0A